MKTALFSSALVAFLVLGAGWKNTESREPAQAPNGTIGVIGMVVFKLTHVGEGSAAEQSGLQANDLILGINRRQVKSLDDVRLAFSEMGTTCELLYMRFNPATGQYDRHLTTVTTEASNEAYYSPYVEAKSSASKCCDDDQSAEAVQKSQE